MPPVADTDAAVSAPLRRWPGRVLIGLLFVLAFTLSLIVSVPATVALAYATLPIPVQRVSGTLRSGEASFERGLSLAWQIDPLRSLVAMRLVVAVRATGPQSVLTGDLALSPRTASLSGGQGSVGWPLVAALLPGIEIRCDLSATLNEASVTDLPLRPVALPASASARVTVQQGTCSRKDGRMGIVPVPALTATLAPDGTDLLARVTADEAPDTPLAEMRATGAGRLIVTIHPEGARRVPGLPASSATELDLPLSVILGAAR